MNNYTKDEKDAMKKEFEKLTKIRTDFYDFLDANIPKKDEQFDFSKNPSLDAKDVYLHFFKLDYQARKLRGFLAKAYGFSKE